MDISNSAINKVGDIIRRGKKDSEYEKAVDTLNLWREAHGQIMDEYYDKCVKLTNTDSTKNIIVAQRLKRLPTIIGKLDRFKSMRLSSMQDIAGVRIIVRDIKQLSLIEKRIRKWPNLYKIYDYILNPKLSGYRGKHFVFRKDGKHVEIQLRTQIQHIWATSIETVDLFRGTSMKTLGDDSYWHDFFCQASAAFALVEEEYPGDCFKKFSLDELCIIIEDNMRRNKIDKYLKTIEVTSDAMMDKEIVKGAYYFVLDLDFDKRICHVSGMKESQYDDAVLKYQKLERESDGNHSIVLVSVNNIRSLNSAYPNYFLNLKYFNELIQYLLEKSKKNR